MQNIVDRPLSRGRGEVSLSLFAYVFSELVQHAQSRVNSIADLEEKLNVAGQKVGSRVLDMICYREGRARREIKIVDMLKFVSSTVWKTLFGKHADGLERSTEKADEYMISDKETIINRFISVPKDMGSLNPAAFVAGIVKGVLDAAGFEARASAHFVTHDGTTKTVILIKFDPHVIARERVFG